MLRFDRCSCFYFLNNLLAYATTPEDWKSVSAIL